MERIGSVDAWGARAPGMPARAGVCFDGSPESVAAARLFTADFLTRVREGRGLPMPAEVIATVRLIVSELVTNACKYAPGPCLLDLEVTGAEGGPLDAQSPPGGPGAPAAPGRSRTPCTAGGTGAGAGTGTGAETGVSRAVSAAEGAPGATGRGAPGATGPRGATGRTTGGSVEITVWDANPELPVPEAADPGRVGRHGLEIVLALGQDFAATREPVGKRIDVRVPFGV